MAQQEWTFTRGFARAVLAGLGVALFFAFVLGTVGAFAPVIMLHLILRIAISFGVAWVLFKTVQAAGGAVGWPFTILATLLTVLAMTLSLVGIELGPEIAPGAPDRETPPPPLSLITTWTTIPLMAGAIGAALLEHEG
jgi:hypothetical protein